MAETAVPWLHHGPYGTDPHDDGRKPTLDTNTHLKVGGTVTTRLTSIRGAEMASDRPKIALCHIEHDGEVYNYGDVLPAEAVEANPNAVGEKPLSADEIDELSHDDLVAMLKRQNGLEEYPDA